MAKLKLVDFQLSFQCLF